MGEEVTDVDAGAPRRWTSHNKTAFALRWLVRLAPVVAATIVVFILLQSLPEADSVTGRLARNSVAVVAGFAVSFVVARFATRLIPLAGLLRLSLVFPDEAPSRFKVAMKASSSRQLERDLAAAKSQGFVDEHQSAAEQILAMAAAIGAHDRRTRGHSERVRVYSRMIGEEMGVDGDELEKLQWGALLHDMGKIHVSPAILNKPGRPDEEEWAELQTHPEEGRHLLAPLDHFLGEWASASWGHHEKWDGSGYPAGLAGADIPLAARIVAVADAYEVMTATRAYKTPMSAEDARRELAMSAGTHFDPEVVRATLALSVGRLQLAAGPMSFILGLPFAAPVASLARTFVRFPDVGTVATAVGAAAVSVAMAGTALATGATNDTAATEAAMATVDQGDSASGSDDSADDTDDTDDSATATAAGTGETQAPSPTSSNADLTATPRSVEVEAFATSTTATLVSSTTVNSTSASDGVASSVTTSPTTSPTTSLTTPLDTLLTTVKGSPTTLRSTTVKATPPSTSAGSPSTTAAARPTTAASSPTTEAPEPGPTISSGNVTVAGLLEAGADLSKRGPYIETSTLLMWDEGTDTLTDDLTVDGTTIAAGTTVTSYYFSYSPVDDSLLAAVVDLGQPILAVASEPSSLRETDDLGPADVTYESSRKLGRSDDVTVSGSVATITLDTSGGTMDQFRVLVAG